MSGDFQPFFREVVTTIVQHGKDAKLPTNPETGETQHTLFAVYGVMLTQICMDFPGLPDPRSLRLREIRFFYDGLRHSLRDRTKKS